MSFAKANPLTSNDGSHHWTRTNGPLGMSCRCNYCRFGMAEKKPPHRPGKGWGWMAYNKLKRAMNEHVRVAHPEITL